MQVMDSGHARHAVGQRTRTAERGHGHPATAEMDYTSRELEFMRAIEEYKRVTGWRFPTWSEALHVVDSLGYAKRLRVAESTLPRQDSAA